MIPSTTHLLLLPTYNTGPRLCEVVSEVLRYWQPVLVVVDGSTDDSAASLSELATKEPGLSVMVLPQNVGKGGAVLAGARTAQMRGFTHALVMDADGQHPAASIAGFMAESQRQPSAMVLGRPIFPPNIPLERLHGRKLSVGLVHLELMGRFVADPLFGFRVYPIAPLLAVLGPRRGGRRYDFDTEVAVRLGWSGVPTCNLDAPVRYFSQAEGGVSHFHYLRDNVTQVWMHFRLLTELAFWRWPGVIRRRRAWRPGVAALAVLLLIGAGHAPAPVADPAPDPLVNPAHQLPPDTPAWADLVTAFSHHADTKADFTERRFFPFKSAPVVLTGEARVSATRGLSLHYTTPEENLVILDDQGMLSRATGKDNPAPADASAALGHEALLHIQHLDLTALAKDFDLYGQRDAEKWTLELVPRDAKVRDSLGRITVEGGAATIRRIEIRRSANEAVEISIAAPQPSTAFTADELKRYFR